MPLKRRHWRLALSLWAMPMAAMAQGLAPAPQPPLSPRDQALDTKILADQRAAQASKGPLDGAWQLRAADGTRLYVFLLSDTLDAPVEGAWRDLSRNLTVTSSGFISEIHRDSEVLTLRFFPHTETRSILVWLQAGDQGQWHGSLTDEAGRKQPVSLMREPAAPTP